MFKFLADHFWPHRSPDHWAEHESKDLLRRVFIDRITTPMPGRTREECEQQCRSLMEEVIYNNIFHVVNAYNRLHPDITQENIWSVLRSPKPSDEDVYYAIHRMLFLTLGEDYEEGICKVVQAHNKHLEKQKG
jgi:hypothetical protein